METIGLKQVQDIIGVSEPTIRKWIREQRFPRHFRIGRRYRFYRTEILDFAEGRWNSTEETPRA